MNISKPVEKTIAVMEYMYAHPKESFSLENLSRECGIPKTTMLRIVSTFLQHGYLSRTERKEYLCNFVFTKAIPLNAEHLIKIKEILQKLVDECHQSAEILTVNGKNLQWYDRVEHPELPIRIAAQIGAKRTLYELDAPSRMYLKFLGLDQVIAQFETSSFYTSSSTLTELEWREAKKIIEMADVENVEYDLTGNRHGVRRFATIISSATGEFLYLLCLAEPALWVDDENGHLQKNMTLLQKYKDELMKLT